MTEKRFWCLEEYEGETSPIVDGKFAPTNGWLCNRLNELYEENGQLKQAYQTLKHRHSLLHDECLEVECDRDSLKKDVISLEKENERLKHFLKEIATDNKINLANGYVYNLTSFFKKVGDVE